MNKENIEKLLASNNPYARATEFSPIVRIYPKFPRNLICQFSGKKFKNCCGQSGQDFCEKAKDSLKEHLNKLTVEREKNEKTNETSKEDQKENQILRTDKQE
jgi:hypothetical protein